MKPPSGTVEGRQGLSDAVFHTIVDNTAHPFVVIAVDGTIRYASHSIVDVVGWEADELVGRNMAEFIVPEHLATAVEAVTEIDKFDRTGAGVPMVFGLQRPDGGTAWVEIGAMPMLDSADIGAIALRLRACSGEERFDEFIAALLADEPLDDILPALCESIAFSLHAEAAVVHYGFDDTTFAAAAGHGLTADLLPRDRGPWWEAVRTGKPCHRAVGTFDPPDAAGVAHLSACWTVPVVASQGIAPAALSVWRSTPGPPLIGHRHVLTRSVRYVELALVRTAEHRRLRHLARHDSLTGVANRSEFRERLASALAIGESRFAVALCDLDNFKPVNDTWGHSAGDEVLVAVADRLRSQLRSDDELARIGGDEFTFLLRNVPDAATARDIAKRLHDVVREPFYVGDNEVRLGLSVGVALSAAASTAEDLMARADAALYEVKRAGGGGVHVSG